MLLRLSGRCGRTSRMLSSCPRRRLVTIGGALRSSDEPGAERQRADSLGRHDRDASGGALHRASAVVADRDAVRALVAFADEDGELLEVLGG